MSKSKTHLVILTAGDISEILSLNTAKTKQILPIFVKKGYLRQIDDKYQFTDEGRKYLEFLQQSKVIK